MTSSSQPVMRMADIIDAIGRRWRVVVLALVVAVIGAGAIVMVWPERYTATATVSVSPISPNPFGSTPGNQQLNMATEQQLVRSTEVATRAVENLDGTGDPRALLGALSVTSPSDSQILQISFTAGSSARAAAGANAFAEAYLESRVETADMLAARMINALDARIDELIDQLGEDASAESLTSAAVQQQIIELRQQQSNLVTVALNPGRIIEAAVPPSGQSGPGAATSIAGGVVAGLLAGVALALLRDRTDRRLTHAGRLGEAIGALVVDGTRETDPDEPFRRALLALGQSHPPERAEGPTLVAVIPSGSKRTSDVAARLITIAQEHGMRARLIDSHQIDTAAVDAGWPARSDILADWSDHDLVAIDLAAVTSGARRIAVALRCHAVIVAASTVDDRRPIEEFAEQLTAAEKKVDIGLLLPPNSDDDGSRTSGGKFAPDRRGREEDEPRRRQPAPVPEPPQLTGWPASTRHVSVDR